MPAKGAGSTIPTRAKPAKVATMRVLFVEDDATLGEATSSSLRKAGFAVDLVDAADDALHAWRCSTYDLAILDIMLPDGSGLDLLRAARRIGLHSPVLVLTALSRVGDRVTGLNAGADDYLVKPFAFEELLARVRALLRRPGGRLAMELRFGNLHFDTGTRLFTIAGELVSLSRAEVIVLERFLRAPERILSKEQIGESIYSFNEAYSANAIEVHIHRVRRKLVSGRADSTIRSLRGLGYVLTRNDKRGVE